MGDDDEPVTRPIPVVCPVCKGTRVSRTKRDEYCWLCLGLGAIDARIRGRWLALGSPMTKEEMDDG